MSKDKKISLTVHYVQGDSVARKFPKTVEGTVNLVNAFKHALDDETVVSVTVKYNNRLQEELPFNG